MALKGKWARGIVPRNFVWVMKDRLAVCERPGGYAANHRKVRRMEEIIWLQAQGFTKVVSLLDTPHNLHAYEELSMPFVQVPLGGGELAERLPVVFGTIAELLDDPDQKLLVHMEEIGDRMLGLIAGYLLYTGAVSDGPTVVTIVERLTERQIGPPGREIVTVMLDEGITRK